jgi:small subunit ribosomal protein S21
MPYIVVREKQPLDLIIRRFRRICEKDALFKRMNFLQNYKKPSEIRKLEKALSRKRAYRRMLRDNPLLAGKAYTRSTTTTRNRQY